MSATCLQEALDCAGRGWAVVPTRGKHPGGYLGAGWQHQASAEPATNRDRFQRWPGANVGVVVRESFVAFDIDRRRGDDDRLHALERELGELPPSPSYTTSDGWRLIFEHPGVDLRPDLAGLEVKRGAQMIVMPGSIHPETGRRYEWDLHPNEVPLAALPGPWLARLTAPKRPPVPMRRTPSDDGDFLRGLDPARYVSDLTGASASPGEKIRCPLPDHDDRTPSFHVFEGSEQGWYCFGCRRGGTIFDLAGYLAGYEPPLRGVAFLEVEQHLMAFYEAALAA